MGWFCNQIGKPCGAQISICLLISKHNVCRGVWYHHVQLWIKHRMYQEIQQEGNWGQYKTNLVELGTIVVIFKYYTLNSVIIAGYQFIKSCTWWQVFEIWYGDKYGYKVSKNHRKQVEVSPWWSDFEQSNMAATGAWKSHISARFTSRIKCDTTFSMFLDMRNPFLLLNLS